MEALGRRTLTREQTTGRGGPQDRGEGGSELRKEVTFICFTVVETMPRQGFGGHGIARAVGSHGEQRMDISDVSRGNLLSQCLHTRESCFGVGKWPFIESHWSS